MQYKNKKHKHHSLSKLLLSGVCFTILTLGLWSCQEDLTGDSKPNMDLLDTSTIFETSSVKDKIASSVAKNIASSLSDQAVIDFMKEKANEKFDGDYNFLIEMVRDETITANSDDLNKRSVSFGSIVSGTNLISSRTAS